MKNIEIKLEIEGKEKIFSCTKVKGILLRKTAEVMKVFEKMSNEFNPDILDELVNYVVEVFGSQFTKEEFYDGIDLDEMVLTIQNVANEIMEKATSKLKN